MDYFETICAHISKNTHKSTFPAGEIRKRGTVKLVLRDNENHGRNQLEIHIGSNDAEVFEINRAPHMESGVWLFHIYNKDGEAFTTSICTDAAVLCGAEIISYPLMECEARDLGFLLHDVLKDVLDTCWGNKVLHYQSSENCFENYNIAAHSYQSHKVAIQMQKSGNSVTLMLLSGRNSIVNHIVTLPTLNCPADALKLFAQHVDWPDNAKVQAERMTSELISIIDKLATTSTS